MDKKLITIMTPTYNRARLLKRLYDKLLEHDSNYFEWLIVDDGSTDDTKAVVDQMLEENKIEINYVYQDNGGKYLAFNTGIENAKGELFFCIDSDDMPADGMVDFVKETWNIIKDQEEVGGIVALKSDMENNILSDRMPQEHIYTSLYDLNMKNNIRGEFSVLYKTGVLNKYRYPNVYPEKFVGECVLSDQIDKEYKMCTLNKVLTVCEYQEDGYTSNIVKNMIKNPTGYKIYYMQRIDMAQSLKERMSYMVRYSAFSQMTKDKNYDYCGKYKMLVNLFYPLGCLLKLFYLKRAR